MPKPPSTSEVIPLPENERRQRRRWPKEEKVRIVQEAQACTKRGEIGALLRREGLYSSLLHQWRRQFEANGKEGLSDKPTGRKPKREQRDVELDQLRRDKHKLEHELKVAKAVIGLQKKVHEVLGLALPDETAPEQ